MIQQEIVKTTPGSNGKFLCIHSTGPGLLPSDFHHFLSISNALGGTNLPSIDTCENWLCEFFCQ
uniref:Putative LOC101460606 [Ceratitis capitata] n=1 Tax=Lepeophtheirus salmonis TaxID=72036 RepID=A0A0K2VFS0_LEPSM